MSNKNAIVNFFKTSIFKVILYFIVSNLTIGGALYFYHIEAQQKRLFEEISNKAKTIGSSVENLIDKAMIVGIPLDEMHGKTDYLNRKVKESKELQYIFITDANGIVLGKNDDAPDTLRGTFKNFAENIDKNKKEIKPFQAFSYFNIALPIIIEKEKFRKIEQQKKPEESVSGYVHLGVSLQSVQNSISDIFFDIAIILFVSIVIGYEFLRFTFLNYVITPVEDLLSAVSRMAKGDVTLIASIRGETELYNSLKKLNNLASDYSIRFYHILLDYTKISKENPLYALVDDTVSELKTKLTIQSNGKPEINPLAPAVENIRIIIFLWLISEGIMTTITPGYTGQFYLTSYPVSKQFFSALPVIIFYISAMLTVPFGPYLTNRYGFRRTLFASIISYSIAFIVLFIAPNSFKLIMLCRLWSGLSLGIIFIMVQNYIATYSTAETRVKNFSIYSIANGSAYLCGIPVGGILIDNVGYSSSFLVCALMSIVAAIYCLKFIVEYEGFKIRKSAVKIVSPLDVTFIPGLASTIICLGFPLRFLTICMTTILVPMLLASLGNSFSMIGRILMIYGVMLFCISPFVYRIIRFFPSPLIGVFVSFFLIIIANVYQGLTLSTNGVMFSLFIFSLAVILHTSSIYAQLNVIADKQKDEGSRDKIIALYFTYERIAFVSGPIVSSLCIAHFDYRLTLLGSAFLVAIAFFAYLLLNKNNSSALKRI
ncbi:MAG: MFS transporter [Candidatus Paracaedibacteraceae bacterium]|nr:MFS transporter [Candidatus Paracaedibacteraceae bacterium]